MVGCRGAGFGCEVLRGSELEGLEARRLVSHPSSRMQTSTRSEVGSVQVGSNQGGAEGGRFLAPTCCQGE
eukprot:3232290-Pyramimonas_sp.AAC.1